MKGIFNMRGVYFFNFKNKKRLPYFFAAAAFFKPFGFAELYLSAFIFQALFYGFKNKV